MIFKTLGLMNLIILHSARSLPAQKTVGATILLDLNGYNRCLTVQPKKKPLHEIDDC
jgi:hypothetical protein